MIFRAVPYRVARVAISSACAQPCSERRFLVILRFLDFLRFLERCFLAIPYTL